MISKKNIKKEKNKTNKILLILIPILLLIMIIMLMLTVKPKITKIELSDEYNKDNSKTAVISVKTYNPFKTECKINDGEWKRVVFGKCKFNANSETYTIKIRNLNHVITSKNTFDTSGIKSFELEGEKTYIALNETVILTPIIDKVGEPNIKIKWTTKDDGILKIDGDKIKGAALGETTLTATLPDKKTDTIKVIVTDVIVPRKLDMTKKTISCNEYTKEEAALLDEILKTRIENKGLKTRAAVIEALRFMALSLENKVPYFFENGRLEPYGTMHYVDGEGRYYHKGMYFSTDKYDEIKASFRGPAKWGCPLTNFDTSYGWTWGAKYPNGLDCSGFITWALYNGGMDVGDIGSGISEGVEDISDLGEMHELTYEFANSGKYKVGDIIARDGHIAMIAGMDDENIYIAESLLKGVVIEKFSYKNKNSKLYKLYSYISTLDGFYESDGNYEDMWYEES